MSRSYNGWPASPSRPAIKVVDFAVAGAPFPSGVKDGDVKLIFAHLGEQLHLRVEKVHKGWCWGFNYRLNRNADNLSCHASGTAIDWNAPAHPNGKRGTWSVRQVAEIKKILAELDGVVQCGEFFRSTVDGMHFEIKGNVADVARVAAKIRAGKVRKLNVVKKAIKKITTPRPKPKAADGKISLSNVRYGKKNADVKEFQTVLNRWYPTLDLVQDGDFGPRTAYAANFARKHFRLKRLGKHAALDAKLLKKLGFKVVA